MIMVIAPNKRYQEAQAKAERVAAAGASDEAVQTGIEVPAEVIEAVQAAPPQPEDQEPRQPVAVEADAAPPENEG